MTLSTKIGIFEKGDKDIFNVEYANKRLLRCDERELEDYDVEDGTEVICDRAFTGKDRLVNIYLPDSVKAIGESAFSGCRKLKGINIPEGVKEIKSYTFRDCDSLEKLSLPESINKIEMGALGKGLKVLTIISPDAEIHRHAFLNCKNLEKLIVPEGSGKYYRTILATARIPAEVEEKNFEEENYTSENQENKEEILTNKQLKHIRSMESEKHFTIDLDYLKSLYVQYGEWDEDDPDEDSYYEYYYKIGENFSDSKLQNIINNIDIEELEDDSDTLEEFYARIVRLIVTSDIIFSLKYLKVTDPNGKVLIDDEYEKGDWEGWKIDDD